MSAWAGTWWRTAVAIFVSRRVSIHFRSGVLSLHFWRCYVSEVQMVLVRLQLLQTRAQHFLSASGQHTFLGLIDLRRVLK